MILAGDIGGTKTLIGLFDPVSARPRPIVVRAFTTLDYPDLPSMIAAFDAVSDRRARIDGACFGVAGPVVGATAELTNVPWRVDSQRAADVLDLPSVLLLNDLEAMAYALPVLESSELHSLQAGVAHPGGNVALIAAGTGLGEALVHSVDGRFIPSPSEGGHADWAARTEREILVLRDLIRRFGRAQVESVISGPGLVNLHRVTHPDPCVIVQASDDQDVPAAIARAAMEGLCQGCMDALSIFVQAYGAEAGNLALRAVATGGVYVGGGIAPKILHRLTDGPFMQAFRDKAPFDDMLVMIPVNVILNPQAGLLGAAVHAANQGRSVP